MLDGDTVRWLQSHGFAVDDRAVWQEALTHGSTGQPRDYQRLEFLGDRVLGLAVAEHLHAAERGAEGQLALRLNALVSKTACAQAARAIDVSSHVLLGKQARDDGAADSDNVLGDVMEALLGACFLEQGYEMARDRVLALWADALDSSGTERRHPKSALQEWAAGNRHRAPEYTVTDRAGPDHRARFTVEVAVHRVGKARATASSKRDAETAAAKAFMAQFG
ncbi:MAG: ribonuclease III [Parerythrobacter sp.]